MLDRTDHAAAPWVLVEAEDGVGQGQVVESVVMAIEAGGCPDSPVPPDPGRRPDRLARRRIITRSDRRENLRTRELLT